MAKTDASPVSLLAHADFRNAGVRRIAACAEPAGPDLLRFQYVLEADAGSVRIPPAVADAGRTDHLWAHTCFEAFVGLQGSASYLELNFSPSGQWAAYRFESYREGMAPVLGSAPRLALRGSEDRLELEAEVRLGDALSSFGVRRLRLALSTVVEDREGRLSYWALRHPPGRPDFHHPDSFSLALELPAHP